MLRNQRLKYKARGASLSCLVTSHVTVGTREKKEEKVSPPEFKGKILRSTPLLPSQGGGNWLRKMSFYYSTYSCV
jgi:hypothetical protein